MPRRSRGCLECKRRRIGCDRGEPSCRQCLISSRSCSGATHGLLVIDQTDTVVSKHAETPPLKAHTSLIIPQPSTRSAYALIFVSEFVSFFTDRSTTKPMRSWLTELQGGSVKDESLALELSMQATALAYCGVASRNPAAVKEACATYGFALSRHSRSISGASESLGTDSICTSVMLSLFEAICSTNYLAYGEHLRAAQQMLALASRGPRRQPRVLSQVARHVQCQNVRVAITILPFSHS